MADTPASGAGIRKDVRVQVPPRPPLVLSSLREGRPEIFSHWKMLWGRLFEVGADVVNSPDG